MKRLTLLGILSAIVFIPVMGFAQGGTALSFNGSSDYVTVSDNSIDLSGDFTVEFWVKFNDVTGGQMLISKNRNPGANHSYTWEIGISKESDNKMRCIIGSSTAWAFSMVSGSTALSTDAYHHVAIVSEGQNLTMYLDGVSDGTATYGAVKWADNSGVNMTFANPTNGSADGYFNGVLDEVRFWNVARSQGQIISAMNQALAGNESGLMAYYNMDDGSGTILNDNQSNGTGNTGTISGATWVVSNAPLPIQLVSFAAKGSPAGDAVLLSWSTVSEVNNFGFRVQQGPAASGPFSTVAASFVPGHGTTLLPQRYAVQVNNPAKGVESYFRLEQIDLDGSVHYSEPVMLGIATSEETAKPREFTLGQNYPNPFNPSTTIRYALPARSHVSLVIFNSLGQKVAEIVNEEQEAGYHDVRFDASRLASGMYFYRIQAGEFVQTRSLLLMK